MKPLRLALMAVAFLGLLVIAHFTIKNKEAKDLEKDNAKQLFAEAANEISEIAVEKNGSEFGFFKKDTDGKWRIEKPIEAEANKSVLEELVTQLSSLIVEKDLGERADLLSFGLDGDGERKIIFRLKDNPKEYVLTLGNNTPSKSGQYAARGDEKRVVVVATTLNSTLEKDLNAFREKKIFSLSSDEFSQIEITGPKGSFSAQLENDSWKVVSPLSFPANKEAVEKWVKAITEAEAKDFPSETATPLPDFGFGKNSVQVSLVTKDKRRIDVTLAQKAEKVYLHSSLKANIYEIEKSVFDQVNVDTGELLEKSILGMDSADIEKLELNLSKKADSVIVKKIDNGSWALEGKEVFALDQEEISTLVNQLTNLKFEKLLYTKPDFKKLGLIDPESGIAIHLKASGKLPARKVEFKLGRRFEQDGQEMRYGSLAAGEVAYTFREFQLSALPKQVDDWRMTDAFSIKRWDAKKINIVKGEKLKSFAQEKEKEGYASTTPTPASEEFEKIKSSVYRLKAVSFADRSFTPDAAGISKPQYKVEVFDEGGKMELLWIGQKNERGEVYCKREADQDIWLVSASDFSEFERAVSQHLN
jgi:hypothetical protein